MNVPRFLCGEQTRQDNRCRHGSFWNLDARISAAEPVKADALLLLDNDEFATVLKKIVSINTI